MTTTRRGSLYIHGQAPKSFEPPQTGSWTLCAGIGINPINNEKIRSAGCPIKINEPKERGTLNPRCPTCYRQYIEIQKANKA